MSADKFSILVKQDTPRLVVMHGYTKDGADSFQWGVVGQLPALEIIGAIVRVQGELQFRAEETCPEPALCIAWPLPGVVRWFLGKARRMERDPITGVMVERLGPIPIHPLIGMLEVIKATIGTTFAARQMAAQQLARPPILGPDGSPIRG